MAQDPLYWRTGARERRNARAGNRARPLSFGADRRRLRIGLVNNMPDAAMRAAELQFLALMRAAAPDRTIEFVLFHLEGVARGADGEARVRDLYRPAVEIAAAGLDALIVTGAEPRAADLRTEPFWPGFTALVEAADTLALPTLWSCLAAHAAVLHSDGLQRHRLKSKRSGVFAFAPAQADPLLTGMGAAWTTPHSRHNGLDEAALRLAGYAVLGHSPEAGVDAFAQMRLQGLSLFLQGHPEYDRRALALEFKRDLQRYLDGEREAPPEPPCGVFGSSAGVQLRNLIDRARARRDPSLMGRWPPAEQLALTPELWRAPAAALCRNWLASSYADAPVERRSVQRPPLHA